MTLIGVYVGSITAVVCEGLSDIVEGGMWVRAPCVRLEAENVAD